MVTRTKFCGRKYNFKERTDRQTKLIPLCVHIENKRSLRVADIQMRRNCKLDRWISANASSYSTGLEYFQWRICFSLFVPITALGYHHSYSEHLLTDGRGLLGFIFSSLEKFEYVISLLLYQKPPQISKGACTLNFAVKRSRHFLDEYE